MMHDGDLAGDHPFCAAGISANLLENPKFISLHHLISQKALLLRRTFL